MREPCASCGDSDCRFARMPWYLSVWFIVLVEAIILGMLVLAVWAIWSMGVSARIEVRCP